MRVPSTEIAIYRLSSFQVWPGPSYSHLHTAQRLIESTALGEDKCRRRHWRLALLSSLALITVDETSYTLPLLYSAQWQAISRDV
jgi:hypothetical protein